MPKKDSDEQPIRQVQTIISCLYTRYRISDAAAWSSAVKLTHSMGGAYLGIQGGSRVVRSHGVVLHLPPGVVSGGGLGVPHITGVTPELA